VVRATADLGVQVLRRLEALDSGERLWRLDVNTHEHDQDAGELGLNAIGRVGLRASAPMDVHALGLPDTTSSPCPVHLA